MKEHISQERGHQVNEFPWLTQSAKRNANYKQAPLDLHEFEPDRAQFLPFDLPEAKKGKHEVVTELQKVGTKLPVVSMRNAIFMGLKPIDTLIQQPTIVHKLKHSKGTWMTTMPQEIEQHRRQLSQAHGHVLVGGLGLGVAVAYLAANARVRSITVVELEKDIINLVWPHVNEAFSDFKDLVCLHADLYDHLKHSFKYDFAFYDIWAPTGERVIMEHTLPLRKASIGRVPQDQIEQWNEDEMIGQVALGLLTDPMQNEKEEYFRKQPAKWVKGYCKSSGSGVYWRAVVANPPGWNTMDRRNEYLCALKDAVRWNKNWKQYEP